MARSQPLLAPSDPALAEALERAGLEAMRILGGDLADYVEEEHPGFVLAGVGRLTAVHLIDTTVEEFDAIAARWEERFRHLRLAPMCWLTPMTRPADAAQRLRRRGYRPVARYRVYICDDPSPEPDLPTGVRLRLASPEDSEFLTEVLRAAFAHRPLAASYFVRVLPQALAHPDVEVVIAELDGRPVFCKWYIRTPPFLMVEAAAALSAFQARGIGSAVMRWESYRFLSPEIHGLWRTARASGPGERLARRQGLKLLYERELWYRVPGPWPVRAAANLTRPLRRRLTLRPRAGGTPPPGGRKDLP